MIYSINKPIGWTSFDVVKKIRGITREKKVGHAGTLDPFAEGVLIIGTGPGVAKHRMAIESYIKTHQPFVLALNTQKNIAEALIDVRAACHPVRLLADCNEHLTLPQPLITPVSMLPVDVRQALSGKVLYDFGIEIIQDTFGFHPTHCILPSSLVMAYALAIATSAKASRVLLAGFDGYADGDPRNKQSEDIIEAYQKADDRLEIISITPTRYPISKTSIYGEL